MKKLMFLMASTLLQRWLVPVEAARSGHPANPLNAKFNSPYLLKMARSYARIAAAAYVLSLLFVGGFLIAAFAAAQSYDSFGIFVPSVVFFTGLTTGGVSMIGLGICYSVAKRYPMDFEQVYLFEETPIAERRPEIFRYLEPLVSGFFSRWNRTGDRAEPHLREAKTSRPQNESPYREARVS